MEDVKIGEILEPVGPGENREREERVRAKFWRTVKKAARQVPFMEELVAGYYCALDNDTPPKVRGILLAALAYFVLPLDVVPDFLLGFGFTDDVAVLAAALMWLSACAAAALDRFSMAVSRACMSATKCWMTPMAAMGTATMTMVGSRRDSYWQASTM